MSGKYRGVFDILTGFLFGASTVKLYYESISDEDDPESFIFRQNQKKIEEIYSQHDNLTSGKNDRIIKPTDNNTDFFHEALRYGQPLSIPAIIPYKNHVLAYDTTRKVPLWVAEHLTKDKLTVKNTPAERNRTTFKPDPSIPILLQGKNDDYLKSGWTRGHLASAGNNRSDQAAMNETFFLSNIVPQNYENNANFWYRMEAFARHLTNRFSEVYIISGPLWLPCHQDGKKIVKYEVIGESNVAVPTHLFKVILTTNSRGMVPNIAAFEIPNSPITSEWDLKSFQVPLEKLEKDAGLRFFPLIGKYENLCDTTSCELISQEMMDITLLKRQINNAKTLEQLNLLWRSTKTNKSNLKALYEKKTMDLKNKDLTSS